MATMRAQFQRFLYPGLKEIIKNAFEELPLRYPQLFNEKTSDAAFEEDVTWAGTGLFTKIPEGIEVPEDNFLPGYPKRYQHDDFGKEIGFTHQMIRDGKVPLWNDRASDMGFSARQTLEVLHADLFNAAFTTALGPDGLTLCSASHPNIRQGTQSNLLAPAATVSVPSVRAMLTQYRRQFDHTGVRRIQVIPELLIHPPEEEFNVLEILKSAGRPDTANRADNVTRNILTPFMYEYLTDANNWFMACAKGRHKLKSYMRERFHTAEREDEKNRINYVQAFFAFSFGYSDYLGIIGSNPA